MEPKGALILLLFLAIVALVVFLAINNLNKCETDQDCKRGKICGEDKKCIKGECEPDGNECAEGELCESNRCVVKQNYVGGEQPKSCSDNSDCYDGQMCLSNKCYENNLGYECITSNDCGESLVCNSNRCVDPAVQCTDDKKDECEDSQICKSQKCVDCPDEMMCNDSDICCNEGDVCLVKPKGNLIIDGAIAYKSLKSSEKTAYKEISSVDPCCNKDRVCGDSYCCLEGSTCCGGKCMLSSDVCIGDSVICSSTQACGGAPKSGMSHTSCCQEGYTCLVNDEKGGEETYKNSDNKDKYHEITTDAPCCLTDQVCGEGSDLCCETGFTCNKDTNECVRKCEMQTETGNSTQALPENFLEMDEFKDKNMTQDMRGTVDSNGNVTCEDSDMCNSIFSNGKYYTICMNKDVCKFTADKWIPTPGDNDQKLCTREGDLTMNYYWKPEPLAGNTGGYEHVIENSYNEDNTDNKRFCSFLSCVERNRSLLDAVDTESTDQELCRTTRKCTVGAEWGTLQPSNKVACKLNENNISKTEYMNWKESTDCEPNGKFLENGVYCPHGSYNGYNCNDENAKECFSSGSDKSDETKNIDFEHKKCRYIKTDNMISNAHYSKIPCDRSDCNDKGAGEGFRPNCKCTCDVDGKVPKAIGNKCETNLGFHWKSKISNIKTGNRCAEIGSGGTVSCGPKARDKNSNGDFYNFLKTGKDSYGFWIAHDTSSENKWCYFAGDSKRFNCNGLQNQAQKFKSNNKSFGKPGVSSQSFFKDGDSSNICIDADRNSDYVKVDTKHEDEWCKWSFYN